MVLFPTHRDSRLGVYAGLCRRLYARPPAFRSGWPERNADGPGMICHGLPVLKHGPNTAYGGKEP